MMDDKLKAALELIKRTCEQNYGCGSCPLSVPSEQYKNDCLLRSNFPEFWHILDDDKDEKKYSTDEIFYRMGWI